MPEPTAEGHSRALGSADQRTAHMRQRGHEELSAPGRSQAEGNPTVPWLWNFIFRVYI